MRKTHSLDEIEQQISSDENVQHAAAQLIQPSLRVASWIVRNAQTGHWMSRRDACGHSYANFYSWACDASPNGGGLMCDLFQPIDAGEHRPLTFGTMVELCELFDLCDLSWMMWLKRERHTGPSLQPSHPTPSPTRVV